MIANEMKNEENGNALYKLIERKNIPETFVSQILKYLMDLIPDLFATSVSRRRDFSKNQ